jgi:hypothetical protein
VITTVDAALAMVAPQRWVSAYDAATVLESVCAVALEVNAPERIQSYLEPPLAGCDRCPIPAARLTDTLLDIRNCVRKAGRWEVRDERCKDHRDLSQLG